MTAGHAGMSAKQCLAIRYATGRVNIFQGAIRSGKTFSWLLLMLEKIKDAGTEGAIVILGKNRDSIFRNVFEPLLTKAVFATWRPHIHYKQGGPSAQILGRTVHVIGLNDARAEEKIRGLTILLCFLDEITVAPKNAFQTLLGRMSPDEAQLYGTTNPETSNHWLKKDYLDRITKLPGWRSFHFQLDDNPSLSERVKASLKAEHTGVWYRRMILGEWCAAEGAVFDMWDENLHVIPWEKIPPITRVFGIGVDYGTTNATAALMMGVGKDKRLYMVDEWSFEATEQGLRRTDHQLATGMIGWMGEDHVPYKTSHLPEPVIVDPAAASFRVQLQQMGVFTHPAENNVGYGLKTMSSLLSADKLRVADRCEGLRNELPGYSWDPKATERGEDAPIKVADHRIDACRYVIATTERQWRDEVDLLSMAA